MSIDAADVGRDRAEQVRYSPDSDVLYFRFGEGEEAYFEEPIPGVHVEYDEQGEVIGVEVLNASQVLADFVAYRSP